MTKQNIQEIVEATINVQKKNSNTWQSWIKLIVTIILVPALSVVSSQKVYEWRLKKLEEQTDKKVDAVWYEQYIAGQQILIQRLEEESKSRDEELKESIDEIKDYLNELTEQKHLFKRDKS